MSKNRFSIYCFLVSIIFLIFSFGFINAQTTVPKVKINGQYVSYNNSTGYPYIDTKGRILVPVTATLEKAGAKVRWDSGKKTATAEKNGIKLEIPMGTLYIYKNGFRILNDTESVSFNGKQYLPTRMVLEILGFKSNYDSKTKTLIVTSGKPASSVSLSQQVTQIESQYAGFYKLSFKPLQNGHTYYSSLNTSQINELAAVGVNRPSDYVVRIDSEVDKFGPNSSYLNIIEVDKSDKVVAFKSIKITSAKNSSVDHINSVVSLDRPLAENSTSRLTLILKDSQGQPVTTDDTYIVKITVIGNGATYFVSKSPIQQSQQFICTVPPGNGESSFEITLPSGIKAGCGISIQLEDINNNNIGNPISFTK
ncbi:MAG: stalk domain-containing protein [Bacillota bacterium]|nr:stalk domain-containing protein [Bacillota bacterium]